MSTKALKSASDCSPTLGQREHHLELGAVALTQPRETQLSGVAQEDHPTGDRDLDTGARVGPEGLGVVLGENLGERMAPLDDDRVRRHAGRDQPLALVPAHPHLLRQLGCLARRGGGFGGVRHARQATASGCLGHGDIWRLPSAVAVKHQAETVQGEMGLVAGDASRTPRSRPGPTPRWR